MYYIYEQGLSMRGRGGGLYSICTQRLYMSGREGNVQGRGGDYPWHILQ